jgi:hypothetical protein
LIGQIPTNEKDGLAPFDAVIEATVQRSSSVILRALAAMLAFIPLTHSVFWGKLAYTLIGGTFGGTVLTLVFLPALYVIWFKIRPTAGNGQAVPAMRTEPVAASEGIGAPAPQRIAGVPPLFLRCRMLGTLAQAMVWHINALLRGASLSTSALNRAERPLRVDTSQSRNQ